MEINTDANLPKSAPLAQSWARRVPEVLPLDREVRESSGDAKDERVKLDKVARGDEGVVRLGRCAEFLEELLRKGL